MYRGDEVSVLGDVGADLVCPPKAHTPVRVTELLLNPAAVRIQRLD